MKTVSFTLNGKPTKVTTDETRMLLWVLRDDLGLTGTKFGCGQALCGACTVHLDGQPIRSCQTPVSAASGKSVTTIEAMAATPIGKKVQAAWIAHDVPQCGYCQSGQIMQAASLLAKNPDPTKQEIVAHMDGNLCRCMTYGRIQRAIVRAAADMRSKSGA